MMFRKSNFQGGYAALLGALVMVFVLSSLVFSTAFLVFQGRFNLLDRRQKIESRALAEGCLDLAVLYVVQSPSYRPGPAGEIFFEEPASAAVCRFQSLNRNGNQVKIGVQASVSQAVTNLLAEFDTSAETPAIISFEETGS